MTTIDKAANPTRLALAAVWAAGTVLFPWVIQAQTAFSYDMLRERAKAMAAKEYQPETKPELPDYLDKLNYDTYQDIRFRTDHCPWCTEPMRFRIQLFHRGYLYKEPVHVHLVEGGQAREFVFTPEQFDYGKNRFPQPVPAGLGFAGLRVTFRSDNSAVQDEVASFLGASYFRIIGLHHRYGASARGLAIDTGEPTGEEFPRFTEFWIEKPAEQANYLQLFALLDSRSAAGAYRFVIKPGENTVLEMETCLFLRKDVKKLGLFPLTSMFLIGKNQPRQIPDFRPEVHDSDGLLVQMGSGERLWRALINPEKQHQVTDFPADNVGGFGLLQRDRDFRSYEDLASRYELHPSFWVQPQGAWGAGAVELVEIPSPSEYNDNIVAYWVPKQKPAPGQELRHGSILTALAGEPAGPPLLRVQATRIQPARDKTPPRFILDFEGNTVPAIQAGTNLTASVQASSGEARNLVLQRNEVTGGWRTFFDLENAGSQPIELHLFLRNGEQHLSETWVYSYRKP